MTETLNLGAGEDVQPNAHNVDIVALDGIDEQVDLNSYPWPWETNAWDRVVARHVLEHVDQPMQAIGEVCRILRPDGVFDLWYPIGHTRFEDPTHTHYWNWNTAETLAGERKHSHEHESTLTLQSRRLEWHADTLHWRVYTRLKLALKGPGPWLSQIEGLHGHVHARYTV